MVTAPAATISAFRLRYVPVPALGGSVHARPPHAREKRAVAQRDSAAIGNARERPTRHDLDDAGVLQAWPERQPEQNADHAICPPPPPSSLEQPAAPDEAVLRFGLEAAPV